jgi:hypothetical protein
MKELIQSYDFFTTFKKMKKLVQSYDFIYYLCIFIYITIILVLLGQGIFLAIDASIKDGVTVGTAVAKDTFSQVPLEGNVAKEAFVQVPLEENIGAVKDTALTEKS